MGHEGNGTLLSYLREKFWADELYADWSTTSTLFSIFSISVRLTDDGFNHLDDVIEAIYSYLKLLHMTEPNERLFHELQTIKANRFRFASEINAFDNVQNVVGNIKQYRASDILTGPKLMFEFNAEILQKFINDLVARKFNIMIISSQPYNDQVTFDSIEPWYGTEYTALDMPLKWIDRWECVKPFPEFKIPDANPFIADNFTIFYEPGTASAKYPTKIFDNDLAELWFRQDDTFLLPTAYYKFQFLSPQAKASTKQ